MTGKTDSLYVPLPGEARGSLLEQVLRDLYDFKPEGFKRPMKGEVDLLTDPTQATVTEWGKTNAFENRIESLVEKYVKEIKDILGDKDGQEIDAVSREEMENLRCKIKLAQAFLTVNIEWRVSQSMERLEKDTVIFAVAGDIILVAPVNSGDMDGKGGKHEEGGNNYNCMFV